MKQRKEEQSGKVFWMPICMSIGVGLGMLFGAISGQLPAGMCIGIGLGLSVGVILDRISRKNRG